VRRGNSTAFEVLVSRYQSRLLSFCRHLLGTREDAEDVLQEVMAAAFNAMIADDRPINVRPWLYRIARNRSLNHLRRIQAIGVDSMDVHLSEHGVSTADKVHGREEFRLLVGDIHELPETQKTALVLREMDALSYEQIADAMETTVPSVKSLLVRARVSLAEAAEAVGLRPDDSLSSKFREELAPWSDEVTANEAALRSWDGLAMWGRLRTLNHRIPLGAQQFAEQWIAAASIAPHAVIDNPRVRVLISRREHRLKGRLARLHDARALESWSGSSGVGRLTYRWSPVARQILIDILQGLGLPPSDD